MKIKTITCHDVYNYGASLQAYALMKYLQLMGHDVEIINYKPSYLKYNLWAIGPRWNKNFILKFLFYLYVVPKRILQYRLRRKFDLFTSKYLVLTDREYSNVEELRNFFPLADVFIAGSDQIWNTESSNGKDPSFFLDFVSNHYIKASYAASFSVRNIDEGYSEKIKHFLNTFSYISVRESTGLKILKSLDINNGVLVLDPVFLLPCKEWNKLAKGVFNEKYILIYDQENNKKIRSIARTLSDKYKLKIYAIENLYPMTYADKRIRSAGPLEFLGLVKNCSVLLTNSFHGTSFSLIFQREFFVFPRTHEKVNSRMVDLLNILNIENRYVTAEFDYNYSNLNYTLINDKLKEYSEVSKDFLDEVVSK